MQKPRDVKMESKKRKPLADITNTYNLIPTSALRELVSASSNANSLPKPPTSILKSIASSTDQKLCSDRSDTSIGSSNAISARNSRSVRFRSPPRALSLIPTQGNKDVANTRRQTIEKNNKGVREVLIGNPTLTERSKDKGKTIAVPYSLLPHESEAAEKRKDKGKAVVVPFSSPPCMSKFDALTCSPTPVQERKDKGKTIDVPFSSPSCLSEVGALTFSPTPVEKSKGIAVPCSSPPRLSVVDVPPDVKRKDKGKVISVPFTSSAHESKANVLIVTPTSVEKVKDKGKAVDLLFSSSSRESEADALILSSTAAEKAKYKGKAIAELFGSSSPEAVKDNQNEIYSSYTPLERNVHQDETNPFSVGFDEIMDDPNQQILKSYICVNKKTNKGKAVFDSFGSSMGKQEQKEKGTDSHSSHSNERRNDGTKGIAGLSVSSIMKTKESGEEFVVPSIQRTKKKGEQQDLSASLLEKTKDKGTEIHQPSDIVEIAEHKEASRSVAVERRRPRRKSQKGKNDAGASSCPPLRKGTNIWNNLDDVEDNKSSSWTQPHSKRKKTRLTRIEQTSELPQDFIKQQKAYFKEVDEFELPEEEISQDELE